MESPGKVNWISVLHEIRYSARTVKTGIRYCYLNPKEGEGLICYSDADLGGNRDEWKYMLGYVFLLSFGSICF